MNEWYMNGVKDGHCVFFLSTYNIHEWPLAFGLWLLAHL